MDKVKAVKSQLRLQQWAERISEFTADHSGQAVDSIRHELFDRHTRVGLSQQQQNPEILV